MKIAFAVLAILVIVIAAILIVGASQPVDHTTTITGTVGAPPAQVFANITDIAAVPRWRHAVKSVQILPSEDGGDRWVETLDHNQKMAFVAIRTTPPAADGHAVREVRLNDPNASYGGTWTYTIAPGPAPDTTILQITETGFIKPWIYRFMMAYVFGMTRNLDQYMHDIQAASESA